MNVLDRRRVRQTKSEVIIVHRRVGRSKKPNGHWGILCHRYITLGVNTTTKDEEVTCMTCLSRMEDE